MKIDQLPDRLRDDHLERINSRMQEIKIKIKENKQEK